MYAKCMESYTVYGIMYTMNVLFSQLQRKKGV